MSGRRTGAWRAAVWDGLARGVDPTQAFVVDDLDAQRAAVDRLRGVARAELRSSALGEYARPPARSTVMPATPVRVRSLIAWASLALALVVAATLEVRACHQDDLRARCARVGGHVVPIVNRCAPVDGVILCDEVCLRADGGVVDAPDE